MAGGGWHHASPAAIPTARSPPGDGAGWRNKGDRHDPSTLTSIPGMLPHDRDQRLSAAASAHGGAGAGARRSDADEGDCFDDHPKNRVAARGPLGYTGSRRVEI